VLDEAAAPLPDHDRRYLVGHRAYSPGDMEPLGLSWKSSLAKGAGALMHQMLLMTSGVNIPNWGTCRMWIDAAGFVVNLMGSGRRCWAIAMFRRFAFDGASVTNGECGVLVEVCEKRRKIMHGLLLLSFCCCGAIFLFVCRNRSRECFFALTALRIRQQVRAGNRPRPDSSWLPVKSRVVFLWTILIGNTVQRDAWPPLCFWACMKWRGRMGAGVVCPWPCSRRAYAVLCAL